MLLHPDTLQAYFFWRLNKGGGENEEEAGKRKPGETRTIAINALGKHGERLTFAFLAQRRWREMHQSIQTDDNDDEELEERSKREDNPNVTIRSA